MAEDLNDYDGLTDAFAALGRSGTMMRKALADLRNALGTASRSATRRGSVVLGYLNGLASATQVAEPKGRYH